MLFLNFCSYCENNKKVPWYYKKTFDFKTIETTITQELKLNEMEQKQIDVRENKNGFFVTINRDEKKNNNKLDTEAIVKSGQLMKIFSQELLVFNLNKEKNKLLWIINKEVEFQDIKFQQGIYEMELNNQNNIFITNKNGENQLFSLQIRDCSHLSIAPQMKQGIAKCYHLQKVKLENIINLNVSKYSNFRNKFDKIFGNKYLLRYDELNNKIIIYQNTYIVPLMSPILAIYIPFMIYIVKTKSKPVPKEQEIE